MAPAAAHGSVGGVSFEELLVVLMGWRGRPVKVAIATGADPPVTVAMIIGRLAGASELSEGGVDAVMLTFADTSAAFTLARCAFAGAGFHECRRSTLLVRQGAVNLWIEPIGD